MPTATAADRRASAALPFSCRSLRAGCVPVPVPQDFRIDAVMTAKTEHRGGGTWLARWLA